MATMDQVKSEKLLRFLLRATGWCFLLEALGVTIALGFTVQAITLIGIGPLLETAEPQFSPTLTAVWGGTVIAVSLSGYYLLAYAFLRLKQWGGPLAILLNAFFFAEELWRFFSLWKFDPQKARILVETLAARARYQFDEQLFEDAWRLSNQTATPLELLGRVILLVLLFVLVKRPEFRALMK